MPRLLDKTYLCTNDMVISGQVTKLSYVDRLFPQLGSSIKVLLFCKLSKKAIEEKTKIETELIEREELALDITGSPLEHSFGDDSFNISITQEKRNWLKNEEKYQPVSAECVLEALNLFQEELDQNVENTWNMPVFGLSHLTKGGNMTVLIGLNPHPTWHMPMRVVLAGTKSLTDIQNELRNLMSNHLARGQFPGSNVDVLISSNYELCGTSHQMIDWKEMEKSDFKGYLTIEAKWDSFTFLPPSRPTSVNLVAEIVSGSKDSALSDLWNQILLLDKYLNILQQYRKKDVKSRYSVMPLNFPRDFSTPYFKEADGISRKVERLLSGDDELEDMDPIEQIPITEVNNDEEHEIKLVNLVEELHKRQNLDFTDQLWKIARATNSYMAMADCLHTIFEEIVEKSYKPQLNFTEDTRFAKMVSEINPEKANVPQLAGSLALELVIDMGLEKISRDYMYLLSSANFMEAYDLRKALINVSSGEFDIQKYREKLMTVAKIHLSLEFLQLIESQFNNCRSDISHSLFEAALKVYLGPDSPFQPHDLVTNSICTLNVPAPKDFVSEVTKTSPSSWMCTLTTENNIETFTSTTHYSKTPIFPPNIYPADEIKHEAGKIYHVTNAYSTKWNFGMPCS